MTEDLREYTRAQDINGDFDNGWQSDQLIAGALLRIADAAERIAGHLDALNPAVKVELSGLADMVDGEPEDPCK